MTKRRSWTLFVCPDCGGYGQNNLGIHLKGGCPPTKCDVTAVEEIKVIRKSESTPR